MQVLAHLAGADRGVPLEQVLELRKQVRFRAEVKLRRWSPRAERLKSLLPHARTVVAVEAVAFDEGGLDAVAAEDLREGLA